MLERRTFPGGVVALVSTEMEAAGFLAAFSERSGGVSDGPFRSLNLGLGTGDSPEVVRTNRRRLCSAIDLDAFACVRQVHGADRVRVARQRAGAGFERAEENLGPADALLTSARGVALAVLTADCVPLALASPSEGVVAAVHAGWRGVAAGVVAGALAEFADPRETLAAVGPAVGPDHYEVGKEVAAAVDAATERGAVVSRSGPRPRVDLAATVVRILEEHGVGAIEAAETCTACEEERFFSHRRDGTTGRQGLVVARR